MAVKNAVSWLKEHGPHKWIWSSNLNACNLGITTGVDFSGTCNPMVLSMPPTSVFASGPLGDNPGLSGGDTTLPFDGCCQMMD